MYTDTNQPIQRRRHICARVTDELRTVLEQAAARETGGDVSKLIRMMAIDWAATWFTERNTNAISQ
jgi:hypothetical protein